MTLCRHLALSPRAAYIHNTAVSCAPLTSHLISELATGQEDKIARLTYRDTFLKLTGLGIYPPVFAEQIAKS